MVQYEEPIRIELDYTVETLDTETGDIIDTHHFESYSKALEKFRTVRSRNNVVLLSLYTNVVKTLQVTKVHKLVLAKDTEVKSE